MKIKREEPLPFKPIVITLETEEEAMTFMAIFGKVGGDGPMRKIVDKLYDFLHKSKVKISPQVSGGLMVSK